MSLQISKRYIPASNIVTMIIKSEVINSSMLQLSGIPNVVHFKFVYLKVNFFMICQIINDISEV